MVRTVETEVLGRCDRVDEEKYTDRVTAPTTRQKQLLVRREPGPVAGAEVALWNLLAQRIGDLRSVCDDTHGQGVAQSSATHVEKWQLAMAFLARLARNVGLVAELAEKPVAVDGREAAGGAADMHAGSWSD